MGVDFTRVIAEVERRLRMDPRDKSALLELELHRQKIYGSKPIVEPNKRYGHVFAWQRFYVKGFVPRQFFPGTMRVHVKEKSFECEPRYLCPSSEFSFNSDDGEVLWHSKTSPFSALFEWTEDLVGLPEV